MIGVIIMELDTEKIKRLKESAGMTWAQIAGLMGLKTRQAAYDLILNKRITGAEKFAKVFGLDPKDLIK